MTATEIDCGTAVPLIPLFFDGELDPRQMRSVALHSARCGSCREELSRLERLQAALAEEIRGQVAAVDSARVWSGIEARLDLLPAPRYRRLLDRFALPGNGAAWGAPAAMVAAVAVLLVLAFGLWRSPSLPEVDVAQDRAILQGVESHVDALALLSQPESHALVLWVSDAEPVGGEEPR